MTIKVNSELYDKVSVLKTAYSFTDDFFLHIDYKNPYFIIDITKKDGSDASGVENSFNNELIAQSVRSKVMAETKTIRELILARAFASTIVEEKLPDMPKDDSSEMTEDMCADWFSKNND